MAGVQEGVEKIPTRGTIRPRLSLHPVVELSRPKAVRFFQLQPLIEISTQDIGPWRHQISEQYGAAHVGRGDRGEAGMRRRPGTRLLQRPDRTVDLIGDGGQHVVVRHHSDGRLREQEPDHRHQHRVIEYREPQVGHGHDLRAFEKFMRALGTHDQGDRALIVGA